MMRFVRFAGAFLLWPLAWALARTAASAFYLLAGSGDAAFSAEGICFFAGLVACLVAWAFLPNPVRFCVLGHELTHAVWGLAFGARVSRLRVGAQGGSVCVSKSNVWITLAPYFFPFWTIVTMLVACAVRLVRLVAYGNGSLPGPAVWMFLVGATWCLHLCFTIRSLAQRQPDVEEYGRVFSWTLILLLNVAGVILWMTLATDLRAAAVGRIFTDQTVAAYAGTLSFCRESLRSLSVLP